MAGRRRIGRGAGFTLVELLVVIGIIAVLIGILIPALARARESSVSLKCASNLRQLGQAFVTYTINHKGYVIPSYTMTGVTGGASVPLEGWASILDRDRYMTGDRATDGSVFTCPAMVDIEGMVGGQTGNDPGKPKGWMDWPNLRLGVDNVPTIIPERGFNKIIRVGYWINADNPIGSAAVVTPDLYYTGSVGYGPGTNGEFIRHTRVTKFRSPQNLIVLTDGVYAGRQRDGRIGATNSRIGYRHGGNAAANVYANVAFADGHVGRIKGNEFPRAVGGSVTVQMAREDNLGEKPTVYADPRVALGG